MPIKLVNRIQQTAMSGFFRLSAVFATAVFTGGLFATLLIPFSIRENGPTAVERGRFGMAVLTEELQLSRSWLAPLLRNARLDQDLPDIVDDCSGMAGGFTLTQTIVVLSPSTAAPPRCLKNAAPDSEVLVVKRVNPNVSPMDALDPERNYLFPDHSTPVLISGAHPPNTTTERIFSPGAYEYSSTIYYVEKRLIGAGRLMQKRLIGSRWSGPELIIDGVETLRIFAGIDLNNDGLHDDFIDYSEATDHQTVALKIVLAIREKPPGRFARLTEFFVPDAHAEHTVLFEMIYPLVKPKVILVKDAVQQHPRRPV